LNEMTLLERIHNLVLLNNAKELADALNKPYSTFMRELNPNDYGAKLGVVDFVTIIRLLNDTSCLDYIESMFGRVAFRLLGDVTSSSDLTSEIGSVMSCFGEFVSKAASMLADGKISGKEVMVCKETAMVVIRKIMTVVMSLDRKVTERAAPQ
jgi:hypothetical protein